MFANFEINVLATHSAQNLFELWNYEAVKCQSNAMSIPIRFSFCSRLRLYYSYAYNLACWTLGDFSVFCVILSILLFSKQSLPLLIFLRVFCFFVIIRYNKHEPFGWDCSSCSSESNPDKRAEPLFCDNYSWVFTMSRALDY